MSAIARIESGRRDAQGNVGPWPWTINVEGQDHVYDTKEQVIAAVRQFQAQGARSIDVGCMQVSLLFHPNAFASLEEAFDPAANARYAAKFLNELYAQTHDWTKATAFYHSQTPTLGDDYQRKVYAVLPEEQRKSVPMPFAMGQAMVPATGGYMLSNGAANVRMIAAPMGTIGRSLDMYRSHPIPIARIAPPHL